MTWDSRRTSPPGDMELIARLRLGDRDALAALFRRHTSVVYGVAYVVTGRSADAEEAVQDAFFLLWQKRADIGIVGSSVLPWLISTARHKASNLRRRATVRQSVPLIEERDAGRVADGETVAISTELQRRLTAAIEQLLPLDQKLVHACLIENMTYEDAATSLGISHGVLRNRLSRARAHLRTKLASERNES